MQISFTVNGTRQDMELDPRVTLLDALRDHLGLTGSKKGCDHGQCGACTVLVEGRRVNACLSLAAMHEGEEITTIEGIAQTSPDTAATLQQAMIDYDGMQCGYCTPGQVCSAVGMLSEAREGWPSHVTEDLDAPLELTRDELTERMSGNLCRCGCYPGIVKAIRTASEARTSDSEAA
ncbi:putative iron-sulfur-binding protein, probably subunit of anoxidoreductase like aldehyde oxidase or xanthine [Pseudooceanicola batsensis HTCC2597]|uniref:Putative iron-sulfur-binding protein, probably subunit of anoxidoreductase like aldehyde oxidase or xanthine n=1 Tax=Pseudooceanicola batsensis (strain ATCC BAA-863 / DSM 15984 / KCTC 12145 / HTCC2597) TaxID=252305 RepID=A3U0I2_PSEBH|nr:2Fe-2S iron-sulfur cluster-binding protein [Pseudooceanicola batsensis]EAQ02273.1 putative iron-sulfur-binding protein, probably subunit of anoxidoreductase like aldehyde oxidase or xanthine [Pseudooceanicola batsensis HTCC2597]